MVYRGQEGRPARQGHPAAAPHRDLVRALFELEVPEIADGIIQIRRIEREPGYRTKLAVDSTDAKVDCVGACVGVRGTRIKSIIDELNGERIDIIRWNDDPETLIANALKPAEIVEHRRSTATRKGAGASSTKTSSRSRSAARARTCAWRASSPAGTSTS